MPLQRKLDPSTRRSHFLVTYARLKKNVALDRAVRDMRALGETLAREYGHNHGIDVRSYNEVVVGAVRKPLQILLGAVLFVLLIACANVANLLLASGLARRREIAVRLALGARHADVARQLVCEALLLACAGGVLGLLAAIGIVRVFIVLAANNLPRATAIQVDGRVLAFTAVTSIAVGVVCGLSPLVRLRLRALTDALRENDTRTASAGAATFGNGLVVGEIAVAFALLVGAGLLVSSLIPSVRQVVSSLDPNLPITAVQTVASVVSASVGQPRLLSALSGLFGALAGLLAIVGVYGVTSYNVRRQRREYGIRLALGADPAAVRWLIIRRGAVVAVAGIAIGTVFGLLLTRVLASMLNDVKPTDRSVFLANAAMVLVVSIAACALPARSAGRVDSARVLRNE